MNDRIGEFPVPPPREAYLPDEPDTWPSAAARNISDFSQRLPIDRRPYKINLEEYRAHQLDDSAPTEQTIEIKPMPTDSYSSLVQWLSDSIADNPVHAQKVTDLAQERAELSGMTPDAFLAVARDAITKFAHDRGRF